MQSSEHVNKIAPNYSPEVETDKPFTRKRKENVWMERSCVYFDETAIVGSKIRTCSHSDLGELLF